MNFKNLKVVLFAATVIGMPFFAANAEAIDSCGACVYPAPANHPAGPIPATVSCFTCHTPPASKPPVTTPPATKHRHHVKSSRATEVDD